HASQPTIASRDRNSLPSSGEVTVDQISPGPGRLRNELTASGASATGRPSIAPIRTSREPAEAAARRSGLAGTAGVLANTCPPLALGNQHRGGPAGDHDIPPAEDPEHSVPVGQFHGDL